jgi:hypothetical protein
MGAAVRTFTAPDPYVVLLVLCPARHVNYYIDSFVRLIKTMLAACIRTSRCGHRCHLALPGFVS